MNLHILTNQPYPEHSREDSSVFKGATPQKPSRLRSVCGELPIAESAKNKTRAELSLERGWQVTQADNRKRSPGIATALEGRGCSNHREPFGEK